MPPTRKPLPELDERQTPRSRQVDDLALLSAAPEAEGSAEHWRLELRPDAERRAP
ncbi:hypothetical protein [Pseudooceanicola sp.]|uniref:hypothetical protein n=1 Tax=Pseudooceanicola sp. TaxID=1914328 RepID=UPI00263758D6|nr:hypothetical protein [Pseudooceanicola sp.]MDF1855286.1 hypothetical protein [Pseudooceanicola sp.]